MGSGTEFYLEWYFDGETVHNHVTLKIANGRIHVSQGKSADSRSLPGMIAIPGLVNAHTHLEFSLLDQPIAPSGRFSDWIRSVVQYRRANPGTVRSAIQKGVAECLRGGATCIGEIATVGWDVTDYCSTSFSGTVFQEFIGLGDQRISEQSRLCDSMSNFQWPVRLPGESIVSGLSPHAPYSVHPDLFQFIVRTSEQSSRPVAIHLAETVAELELLDSGTGEFREMLSDFGLWREGIFGGRKPMEFLQALANCSQGWIIHGNYLDDSEVQFLAQNRNLTLVYCPRTHAAFGHSTHPWRRLLELGGNVAIGTDSRASNPDLSLFAELQFLSAQSPDMSHLDLLKLACVRHSPPEEIRADLCLVEWGSPENVDPTTCLFAAENSICGTMVQGRWCYLGERLTELLDV